MWPDRIVFYKTDEVLSVVKSGVELMVKISRLYFTFAFVCHLYLILISVRKRFGKLQTYSNLHNFI